MKLNVEGMTCSHCERAVQRAIAGVGGTARVDLAAGTVEIEGVADAAAVQAAIEDAGYQVVDAPSAPGGGCCASAAR